MNYTHKASDGLLARVICDDLVGNCNCAAAILVDGFEIVRTFQPPYLVTNKRIYAHAHDFTKLTIARTHKLTVMIDSRDRLPIGHEIDSNPQTVGGDYRVSR